MLHQYGTNCKSKHLYIYFVNKYVCKCRYTSKENGCQDMLFKTCILYENSFFKKMLLKCYCWVFFYGEEIMVYMYIVVHYF